MFIISNVFGKVYMKYNLITANLSYYKTFENMANFFFGAKFYNSTTVKVKVNIFQAVPYFHNMKHL